MANYLVPGPPNRNWPFEPSGSAVAVIPLSAAGGWAA
jgi:hypothetical protein